MRLIPYQTILTTALLEPSILQQYNMGLNVEITKTRVPDISQASQTVDVRSMQESMKVKNDHRSIYCDDHSSLSSTTADQK